MGNAHLYTHLAPRCRLLRSRVGYVQEVRWQSERPLACHEGAPCAMMPVSATPCSQLGCTKITIGSRYVHAY